MPHRGRLLKRDPRLEPGGPPLPPPDAAGPQATPSRAAAGGGGQAATPRPEWRAAGASPMRLLDSPMEGTVLMGSPPKV